MVGGTVTGLLVNSANAIVGRRTEEATPTTAQPGYRRYEFAFSCPPGGAIELHSSAFFDLVPTHVNFAQVQTDKGDFIEQLLTKDQQSLDLGGGRANRLQNASFFEYVRLGVMHIFTGVDHMSFLVGLVLISRRLKDLLFVVTGFTIGHSLTLALAVTGLVRPHAEYIDALVALTIALIGAENLAVATRKPESVAIALGGLLLVMTVLKLFGHGGLPALLLLGAGLFSANYLMISGHLRDAGRLRLVVTMVLPAVSQTFPGVVASAQSMALSFGGAFGVLTNTYGAYTGTFNVTATYN
jgi:uncharacterized membrane protein